MRKSLLLNLIFGVIMLTSLLSAFGIGKKEEIPKMYQRQIDISGNIFTFMMPENFSRDMPAENLAEQIDLNNSSTLNKEGFITLMRRWWELKEPGFFGKEQGTVMMSITVRNRPKNIERIIKDERYNFHLLHHFVLAIHDSLVQRHREHNEEVATSNDNEFINEFSVFVPSVATQMGEEVHAGQDVIINNGKHWIRMGTVQGKQSSKYYALPLNEDHYIEIEFAIMPNDNIAPYTYLGIARDFIRPIFDTFTMDYAEGNEFDEITRTEWKDKTFLGELNNNNIELFPDENIPPEL